MSHASVLSRLDEWPCVTNVWFAQTLKTSLKLLDVSIHGHPRGGLEMHQPFRSGRPDGTKSGLAFLDKSLRIVVLLGTV